MCLSCKLRYFEVDFLKLFFNEIWFILAIIRHRRPNILENANYQWRCRRDCNLRHHWGLLRGRASLIKTWTLILQHFQPRILSSTYISFRFFFFFFWTLFPIAPTKKTSHHGLLYFTILSKMVNEWSPCRMTSTLITCTFVKITKHGLLYS